MPLRDRVLDLAQALRAGGDAKFADLAEAAAASSEERLHAFLTSNDLWGGAGSVADQAVSADDQNSKRIVATLVALGTEQLKAGITNVRTEMWVSAYEEWARRGI